MYFPGVRVFRAIKTAIRMKNIVLILIEEHNFIADPVEDQEVFEFLFGMITTSKLNNKDIAKETLEVYSFNGNEFTLW